MRLTTDFLIIGSGIAGLRAAVDLANHGDVTILTKADPTESNTGYAQGGIAAAVGAEDSPEEHFADTVAAGDGLCNEAAVRVLVDDGVTYVTELLDWGAEFDRDASGAPALGREGAHRVRRVLHAKDATGREIGRLLWSRVSERRRVRVLNHTRAIGIEIENGRCVGARFANEQLGTIQAGAVLLATGGAGHVYRETTNPSIATGDGVAMAWRAGARVADLEFVQFHPTALAVEGAPRFLLSEALRGEGARLLNADGDRFMSNYERAAELASRDLVSRAIVREMERTGSPVYLSLQHLDADWVHQRFPTIAAACRSAGLDLARDLIPVGPAAHYVMGGVETDLWARTTVPGLFAAGEVACTGVHGANRLASNSLLEGLVFGARAAKAMRAPAAAGSMDDIRIAPAIAIGGPTHPPAPRLRRTGASPPHRTADPIRELMWAAVGLSRHAATMERAVRHLTDWHQSLERRALASPCNDVLWRASSIATVAWLIAVAALRRQESRGAHYREDFAARDDVNWRFHIAAVRA